MKRRVFSKALLYLLITLFFGTVIKAELDIVAITGQTAPDENGVFSSSYGNPMINNAGEIAFLAGFSGTSGGTDNNVGWIKADAESLQVLARKGDSLPSGDGTYRLPNNFWVLQVSLDDAGNTSVVSQVTGAADNAEFAMIHFDNEGAVEIVRDNQIQSDESGNFFEFTNLTLSFYHPVVGDDGEVYFYGVIDGPDIGDTFLINRWDRTSGLEYIIGSGDPVLENTAFSLRGQFRLASPDKLALTTGYLDDGEFAIESGIADWTPENGHRTFIRHNDVTPDNISNFTGLGPMTILDASEDGRVLFSAFFTTPTGTGQGIFVDNGTGVIEVAKQDQEIDGAILRNGITGKLGAPGETWFTAQTQGSGTYSLFRESADGIQRILKQGDPMPGLDNTTFDNVSAIYPNYRGDVLFNGFVVKDGVANNGYYMWRDCRFVEVAIVGQALLDSTIQTISLGKPFGTGDWPNEKVINGDGQVALQIALQDGRSAIAIWNPPPPVPLPILAVRLDNNDGIVSFVGQSGFVYQLQKLPAGGDWASDWADFGDPISGTGLLHQVTDTNVISALDVFYRLKLAP